LKPAGSFFCAEPPKNIGGLQYFFSAQGWKIQEQLFGSRAANLGLKIGHSIEELVDLELQVNAERFCYGEQETGQKVFSPRSIETTISCR